MQRRDHLLRELMNPHDAVLLVVDMQNAFCHPHGGLANAGRNIDLQRAAIAPVHGLVRVAHASKLPVIWTLQEHLGSEDRTSIQRRIPSHREKYGVQSADSWCVRNTWDAEIVDELKPEVEPDDHVIRKHRMSCFYSTRLDSLLRIRQTRTIVVVGVATYVCVESTVRDAYFRDFDIIVVSDAVGASDRDLHNATLRKVDQYFGLVASTEDVVTALKDASAVGAPE